MAGRGNSGHETENPPCHARSRPPVNSLRPHNLQCLILIRSLPSLMLPSLIRSQLHLRLRPHSLQCKNALS